MPHATHEVTNQPPPFGGHNAWSANALLKDAVRAEGCDWAEKDGRTLGEVVGDPAFLMLVDDANRYPPVLHTHDRGGRRIDSVTYHPAYHELMRLAFGMGLHSLAWTEDRPGAFVARAALVYLWNEAENGVACPVTMSFAARQVLQHDAALAAAWQPRLLARDYDPRTLPFNQKRAVTIGMAMTEKQGGSDLRANTTRAKHAGGLEYRLTGHKWFCSAPMSDGFFTLAKIEGQDGVTCFFLARTLPDGQRNPFLIQRLKDKVGNRSNASSEVEFDGTLARRIGEEGRGIATLIEMAHYTRFDIVTAAAGMMRSAFDQAHHHASHRNAFGRRLVEQPLMANVLADIALETEAAMRMALRLARAFDEDRAGKPDAALLARAMTPVAKYWLCKRLPAVATEAMECIGGSGYVEEHPLARLYREAPLNGIWEGSGNVVCLDLLRSLSKNPQVAGLLLEEIRAGGARMAPVVDSLARTLSDTAQAEAGARRTVEQLAIALQASLMLRHADGAAAEAFCASRVDSGLRGPATLGTLPASADCNAIITRAALK